MGDHDLIRLAKRIEKAERGSYDLDADVYEALGYRVIRTPAMTLRNRGPAWRYSGWGPFGYEQRWVSQQHFTMSLDRAILLIPAKWGWEVRGTGYARLVSPKRQPDDVEGFAATPALALVAACLRVRAGRLTGAIAA